MLDTLWTEIEDFGVGSEFTNHLTTGAAGGTSYIAIVDDCYRSNANLLCPERSNGGEDRRALGAVGQSIRRVFDVASGKGLSILQQHGRSYAKLRIGRIGVFVSMSGGSN